MATDRGVYLSMPTAGPPLPDPRPHVVTPDIAVSVLDGGAPDVHEDLPLT